MGHKGLRELHVHSLVTCSDLFVDSDLATLCQTSVFFLMMPAVVQLPSAQTSTVWGPLTHYQVWLSARDAI